MISVIMLTYNRDSLVRNMIEDVLQQSFDDFEFIIINNGSIDNTKQILDEYNDREDRIKVINLDEPCTIGFARNLGVTVSTGEYVAFVDDDDRIENDYLDFLYGLMIGDKADISICGCTEGDGISRTPQCIYDGKMVIDGVQAVRLLLLREKIRAGMPTKLYKRAILEKYPFDENCRNEDIHTQYKYLLEAERVSMHGVDKYYILRHGSNVSGFTSAAKQWNNVIMLDYLRAYRDRTKYIEEKAPNIASLARYCEWSFWISMVDKIIQYDLKDCEEIKDMLLVKLRDVQADFLSHPEIKDFEQKWMKEYVGHGNN